MNDRLPYRDMRKLALLAREKIGQKRLLTETDQLLRKSRDLISHTQELIREKSAFDTVVANPGLTRPLFQVTSLNAAREELSKAIAIIERTKW